MDRNYYFTLHVMFFCSSLSARRAWIEINSPTLCWIPKTVVALRKESVDRNSGLKPSIPDVGLSLSARRAWIEMTCRVDFFFF